MSEDGLHALVTGANGFIGSNLCRALTAKGWRVRALVLPGTPVDTLDGLPIEIVPGDITNAASLDTVMAGITHVFHLAAKVGDWGREEDYQKVNHHATGYLLVAAMKAGVKRFMLTSSVSVHAYTGHDGTGEEAPLNADINAYARSKIGAENLVRTFQRAGKIETVIVRPGLMPYGPGDRTSFLPMAQAIEKGGFGYINGGRARLGTSYAGNLVEGMILACTHPAGAGETFLLGDDDVLTWRQVGESIADGLGVKRPKMSVPYPLAWLATAVIEMIWRLLRKQSAPPLTFYRISVARRDLVFSNAKAKRLLGFNPQVRWDEGFQRTLEWYRKVRQTVGGSNDRA